MVEAAVIIIGNEILSGRTKDKNLSYIATCLATKGIRLAEGRVIQDEKAVIVKTLRELSKRYDYVITTGGIGPTHDDITAPSVAAAFGVPLERNRAIAKILTRKGDTKAQNEARLKMADIPQGAELLENPVTGASGFCLANVYVLAGVPEIMQGMLAGVLARLKGGKPLYSEELAFAQCVESHIAKGLADIQRAYPEVSIGSYPKFGGGKKGVNVVLRSEDKTLLAKATEEVKKLNPV